MLNGGFDGMGILCVFCVYDTIGNRCFEKTLFPKIMTLNTVNILKLRTLKNNYFPRCS